MCGRSPLQPFVTPATGDTPAEGPPRLFVFEGPRLRTRRSVGRMHLGRSSSHSGEPPVGEQEEEVGAERDLPSNTDPADAGLLEDELRGRPQGALATSSVARRILPAVLHGHAEATAPEGLPSDGVADEGREGDLVFFEGVPEMMEAPGSVRGRGPPLHEEDYALYTEGGAGEARVLVQPAVATEQQQEAEEGPDTL
ncbi:hypothetical protein cyc_01009 [Cyclospora cayetanensis]|nr:hypothetical protein cyc_01009 [Cyclospora cayetanensis]